MTLDDRENLSELLKAQAIRADFLQGIWRSASARVPYLGRRRNLYGAQACALAQHNRVILAWGP